MHDAALHCEKSVRALVTGFDFLRIVFYFSSGPQNSLANAFDRLSCGVLGKRKMHPRCKRITGRKVFITRWQMTTVSTENLLYRSYCCKEFWKLIKDVWIRSDKKATGNQNELRWEYWLQRESVVELGDCGKEIRHRQSEPFSELTSDVRPLFYKDTGTQMGLEDRARGKRWPCFVHSIHGRGCETNFDKIVYV